MEYSSTTCSPSYTCSSPRRERAHRDSDATLIENTRYNESIPCTAEELIDMYGDDDYKTQRMAESSGTELYYPPIRPTRRQRRKSGQYRPVPVDDYDSGAPECTSRRSSMMYPDSSKGDSLGYSNQEYHDPRHSHYVHYPLEKEHASIHGYGNGYQNDHDSAHRDPHHTARQHPSARCCHIDHAGGQEQVQAQYQTATFPPDALPVSVIPYLFPKKEKKVSTAGRLRKKLVEITRHPDVAVLGYRPGQPTPRHHIEAELEKDMYSEEYERKLAKHLHSLMDRRGANYGGPRPTANPAHELSHSCGRDGPSGSRRESLVSNSASRSQRMSNF
ncbi:uncharacterized protein FOMMEDRAFT_152834 [Fomitiporia mediterranea MF3/22]|uniref:uncharacterized protein n=1 Tax=Fomitiporia mediterranea (strain MF3/22) TaxID=694068 RepID=UPI0004408C9D|nr:uncharacterized protein FOMMEDRAFT_152834 [Fomitiporia mediterranea MF3/22]EJD05513.1 hypothetical protein FOMMEDRAFT_152834 [Fomitiporia mediterranea MF3/22]